MSKDAGAHMTPRPSGSGLDLVYLRQLAEATTEGPWLMQGYANAVVLSLLDRIAELEASLLLPEDEPPSVTGERGT